MTVDLSVAQPTLPTCAVAPAKVTAANPHPSRLTNDVGTAVTGMPACEVQFRSLCGQDRLARVRPQEYVAQGCKGSAGMPPGSTIYAAHHFDPATFVVHLPARHEPAEASGSSESDACESSKRTECKTFEGKKANFPIPSTTELPRKVFVLARLPHSADD